MGFNILNESNAVYTRLMIDNSWGNVSSRIGELHKMQVAVLKQTEVMHRRQLQFTDQKVESVTGRKLNDRDFPFLPEKSSAKSPGPT